MSLVHPGPSEKFLLKLHKISPYKNNNKREDVISVNTNKVFQLTNIKENREDQNLKCLYKN